MSVAWTPERMHALAARVAQRQLEMIRDFGSVH